MRKQIKRFLIKIGIIEPDPFENILKNIIFDLPEFEIKIVGIFNDKRKRC